MTNYEHYKEEIDKIWETDNISVTNEGIRSCSNVKCSDCLLAAGDGCSFVVQKWLVSEYKDPAEDVDWGKIPVDTPIFVRDDKNEAWIPRYFAKYKNDKIYSFPYGSTSWSHACKYGLSKWRYAKLANPEDLKPQIQEKTTMSKEELMDQLCEKYKNSCQKSARKEMFEAVDNFWNSDIKNTKKQKIANMVMELLKMEEEENV